METSDTPTDTPTERPPRPSREGLFAEAGAALEQSIRVAEAALALLLAELRLARSSAVTLVWLTLLLIFLGVGAWLATSAAIAAGLYELTGNLFYGIGGVALMNVAGIAWVLLTMRRCWNDLTMPRTRRLIEEMKEPRHESP